jgi:Immunity protein 10
MMSFVATVGAAQELEDINTFAVILAEHPDGSGCRLEFQIALEFDEQDEEMGMDTYCLCTETGATHYGGVVSWQIVGSRLEVSLDREAAEELGLDVDLSIELQMPSDMVNAVRAGLQRVLAPAS